jgi:hypothetical protein
MDSIKIDSSETLRFLTVVNSIQGVRQARLLMESLRSFGGEFGNCPVWVFVPGTVDLGDFATLKNVSVFPLDIEAPYRHYELADKVFACARAEELAGVESQSLVWLNLDCLMINPPALFDLGSAFDAALRPVHIKNVGSLAQEPLDDYWKTVYRAIGVEDAPFTVESFVDSQTLRPYFNTHCFSINPVRGILQAWREYFKLVVTDKEFQAGPCRDGLHRLFLHQVVLSALIMKSLDPARIRILPPEYSYPLHLQHRLPISRRVKNLNALVCAVYEDEDLSSYEVQEPLKSWLAAHP